MSGTSYDSTYPEHTSCPASDDPQAVTAWFRSMQKAGQLSGACLSFGVVQSSDSTQPLNAGAKPLESRRLLAH